MNSAQCTFTEPMGSVRVVLWGRGQTVLDQTINIDPPSIELRFPISSELVPKVPMDLETCRYDRLMTVTSTDVETIEVELDYFSDSSIPCSWLWKP